MNKQDDEIKIALVMDDYKVKNREELWAKALKQQPQILRDYNYDREEMGAGITPNTTISYRYFKLKKKEAKSE